MVKIALQNEGRDEVSLGPGKLASYYELEGLLWTHLGKDVAQELTTHHKAEVQAVLIETWDPKQGPQRPEGLCVVQLHGRDRPQTTCPYILGLVSNPSAPTTPFSSLFHVIYHFFP